VVMKSAFGSGYAVFGSHPEIKAERVKFSEEVKMIRQKGVKVTTQYSNRVCVSYNFAERFKEVRGLPWVPEVQLQGAAAHREGDHGVQGHRTGDKVEQGEGVLRGAVCLAG
jgi:hypothetical protein